MVGDDGDDDDDDDDDDHAAAAQEVIGAEMLQAQFISSGVLRNKIFKTSLAMHHV